MEYNIPQIFFDDTFCANCFRDFADTDYRALISATGKSKRYRVTLTDRDARELVSRAQYYDDVAADMWQSHRGLIISARATIKAMAQ